MLFRICVLKVQTSPKRKALDVSIMYYKNALTQNGVSEKWVCFVALYLCEVVGKKKRVFKCRKGTATERDTERERENRKRPSCLFLTGYYLLIDLIMQKILSSGLYTLWERKVGEIKLAVGAFFHLYEVVAMDSFF